MKSSRDLHILMMRVNISEKDASEMNNKLTAQRNSRTEGELAAGHWRWHGFYPIYFKSSGLEPLIFDRVVEAFNRFNKLRFTFLVVACMSGIQKIAPFHHHK